MQVVPTQATASQTFNVTLGSQSCTINVYAKEQMTGTWPNYAVSDVLYLDLYVSGVLIIGGVMCLHAVQIVRDAYLGFTGDLAFYDTQGTSDPSYTGLGSRWQLFYFDKDELPQASD